MEVVTRTDIITHKVLNEATGELESKQFIEQKTKKTIRGGFNLMYHMKYEEVNESVVTSKTDLKLFNWITNRFTYQKVDVPLIYSECNIPLSQPKFSRFIKSLVEVNYLLRTSRGVYRLNPFIYVPFRADGSELQAEWMELTQT